MELFSRPYSHWQHCMPPSPSLGKLSNSVPRFLRPRVEGEDHGASEHAELKFLSSYHSCGLPWAKSASKEAMSLSMETPSLTIIQALECVQLYWFGVGKPHPGNLCLGKAFSHTRVACSETGRY